MDMKLNFNFSLPTAWDDGDSLRWYKRDAKRIKKRIAWDSGVYHKTENGKYIIAIVNKDKLFDLWIVDMVVNISTGRTRVTPVGEVGKLIPRDNDLYQYTLVDSDNTYKKID